MNLFKVSQNRSAYIRYSYYCLVINKTDSENMYLQYKGTENSREFYRYELQKSLEEKKRKTKAHS